MKGAKPDLRVIVLAAQRKGITDPLAARFDVSHKCLVPMQGRPLIAHVLETLAFHPGVKEIVVSVEAWLFGEIEAIAAVLHAPVLITPVEAADNLAESVFSAADSFDGPILITTADNALLAPTSVDAIRSALGRGDVTIPKGSAVSISSATRAIPTATFMALQTAMPSARQKYFATEGSSPRRRAGSLRPSACSTCCCYASGSFRLRVR